LTELKSTERLDRREKTILVGVLLPDVDGNPDDPLDEIRGLAKTAGLIIVGSLIQRRREPDIATYIGSGKVEELKELVEAHEADLVLFDNDLGPAQTRNLERLLGVKVIDRTEVILDIFATSARTHEAHLQVELAQLEYALPRLKRMWTHLSRYKGGIGVRGPGEKQLEEDRRLVTHRIQDLKAKLSKVQARKEREVAGRGDVATVSLVGYTNAGKSTLMNALTGADVFVEDKLFATLDTKTRAWRLERGTTVMLSDTVGFVRDLPHNLVASFRATLEEAVHADLLLHVLDVGHPHAEQQFRSVHQVLGEIGAKDKPEILLLNKIDTEEGEHQYHTWKALHPEAIGISARTGRGLGEVAEAVYQVVRGHQVDVTLEADVTNGRLLSFIESHTRVHDRQFVDGRIQLRTVMGKQTLADLTRNDQVAIMQVEAVKE
jgi:GTP-binding protein HflX